MKGTLPIGSKCMQTPEIIRPVLHQRLPALSLVLLIVIILCSGLSASQTITMQPGPAPTPPMGWASWNHFFCDYNEQTIRDQADALVATGMRDLGYKYVLIQECIAPKRDASGELVIDAARFPHGVK